MDIAPERVTRLVYVNAFVPNRRSLNDMVPPIYVGLFRSRREQWRGGAAVSDLARSLHQ
jgi:hypothetical protein